MVAVTVTECHIVYGAENGKCPIFDAPDINRIWKRFGNDLLGYLSGNNMPFYSGCNGARRKRSSKAGRELDKLYQQHKIGWAHYMKIWDKPKYWEWL